MSVNLNQGPYFDDYDPEKGFYQVLFKPGFAVQTRELNQLQTVLQKQIDRFGQHVFREGSIVLGGSFDLETDLSYIKVSDLALQDTSSYIGRILIGTTSGVKAYVRAIDFDSATNTTTFLIRYTSSGPIESIFTVGENLNVESGNNLIPNAAIVTEASAEPVSSLFSIEEGVVFTKGYFVAFPTQRVVLDILNSNPTTLVGFKIDLTIISVLEDNSLFDNASGSTNFAAPGADRLAIGATLVTGSESALDDPNFVSLANIQNGVIQQSSERTSYSRLYEEIAKRTFDESGDYYVRGFGIRTREHLDTGTNEGLLTVAEGGDSNLLSIDVEPGLAYVKGYEVNHLITKHVITDKSTDFDYVNGQPVSARSGGYLELSEIVGSPILDSGTIVTLYDTAETRITDKIRNTVGPSGAVVGTARIKGIEYQSGILGTASARVRLYLYDITMTSGIFSNVRAIYSAGGAPFFADVILSSGSATLNESTPNDLLFNIGSVYTRDLYDELGQSDTSFVFDRTETRNITRGSGNGELTLSISTTGESAPYGIGLLSSSEKRNFILSMNEDADFQLPGTASGTISTNAVTGVGTFFTRLNPGDKVKFGSNVYTIATVGTNTTLTTVETIGGTFSGETVFRSFLSGDIVDLTVQGSSGNERTVVVNNTTSITIDLQEDVTVSNSGTISATISYRINRSSAGEIEKILRPNRIVLINASTLGSLSDPINLGISDVWRIREIRKDTSPFATLTQGSVVTSDFIFNNGQKDNQYDHANITPRFALGAGDHLLIKLDYFEPSFSGGFGYFSVDSYPIDDTQVSDTTIFTYEIPKYVSSAGFEYNLRDVLDFRPLKLNTAANATTIGTATTNPGTTTTLNQDGAGLRMASVNSSILVDYSYYLARRDVVTLDENGNFSILKGSPDIFPVTPRVSENVMGIANVYIPPYPSISETLGRILNNTKESVISEKITNKRFTMREIGVLKNRIESLEYYNALNLLETNTVNLTILDENGLDRFKNGFFVDGFLDHSLGATDNEDYSISVDSITNVIRPFFKLDSFNYDYVAGQSSGVQQTGNLISLPYSEVPLLEQTSATTTRNVEQSVYRFIGKMSLFPDTDVWVDENVIDREFKFGDDRPLNKTMNTEWGSWENHVTGYNVYHRKKRDRSGSIAKNRGFVGTFSTYAEALKAAPYRALIEKVSTEQRSGTEFSYGTETNTQEIGSFVTDVSVQPYIRPQTIRAYVQGLKPNTRYYGFFDGEPVSAFITPSNLPVGNIDDIEDFDWLAEGSPIMSNDAGEIVALLRLPKDGKRFRTGTKEVVFVDNPTNSDQSTSFAKEYFVASGLSVQKQNTILSTKVLTVTTNDISQSRTSGAGRGQVIGPSCLGYTFTPEVPEGEEGIFLTSVEVFVQGIHPSLGARFQIREVNSAGNITQNVVPYGEVWYKRDNPAWNITQDASTSTVVTFPSPVFLYNNVQYALIISAEHINPDLYVWVSRLGENDIITGDPVNSRPLTGALFTTNNGANWDIVPQTDLKVKFNRASFNVNTQGNAIFGNKPYEFLTTTAIVEEFEILGERIFGSDGITLASLAGVDTIAEDDIIVGGESGIQGTVISIDGSTYYTDGYGFIVGEPITVLTKDNTATILSKLSGVGNLRRFNQSDNTMILENSNGQFFTGAKLVGEFSELETNIVSFDSYNYSTVNIKPHFLNFNRTGCAFEKRAYIPGTGAYGAYVPAEADGTSSYHREKAILSRSNEVLDFGSLNTSILRASMISPSEYLSPVVDISKANSIYVYNIVNNDATGEDAPRGGNLLNRYISKTVTLAESQDAEDLLVSLTAYKPLGSDIRVWVKAKNKEDGTPFSGMPWIEMTTPQGRTSSLVNESDFIEFNFNIPVDFLNDGIFEYESGGNVYSGFKQFAIKVGLLGTDSALVPRVGDLRAIALQK